MEIPSKQAMSSNVESVKSGEVISGLFIVDILCLSRASINISCSQLMRAVQIIKWISVNRSDGAGIQLDRGLIQKRRGRPLYRWRYIVETVSLYRGSGCLE